MSAFVNRYKRVFLWEKNKIFFLYKIGTKPKTFQIAFLLRFQLMSLGKFHAVEFLQFMNVRGKAFLFIYSFLFLVYLFSFVDSVAYVKFKSRMRCVLPTYFLLV